MRQRRSAALRTASGAARLFAADVGAVLAQVIDQRFHQGHQVGHVQQLAAVVAAQVVERLVDQCRHFVDVGQQLIALCRGSSAWPEAQTHARQRCAQIVRDGGEEARALVDLPQDLFLHLVEDPRCRGALRSGPSSASGGLRRSAPSRAAPVASRAIGLDRKRARGGKCRR